MTGSPFEPGNESKSNQEPDDNENKDAVEELPQESKLIASYNLTYEQIKKKQAEPAAESDGVGRDFREMVGNAQPSANPANDAGSTEAKENLPRKEESSDKASEFSKDLSAEIKSADGAAEKTARGGRFARLANQFKKLNLGETSNPPASTAAGNLLSTITGWVEKNRTVAIAGLVILGMGLAWGISRFFFQKKDKSKELTGVAVAEVGTRVDVLKVTKTDFSDSILAMGDIKGFAQVNLAFTLPGVISAFYFRDGDEIKAGQIIAQIDPQEQLLKYEKAKVDYEKNQGLYDLGALVPAKLQEAKINLDLAQTELSKTAVVAPSDGILGSRDAEVGSTVTPNMKVATFLDIDDVFAEVGIMEREINKVVLGQSVKINVDAYPDLDFGGTVTNISPMVKGKSKTLDVKVQVANPYRLLLPGMFVRVRIKIFEAKNAIIIPRPALKKVKGAYNVFTVNENNRAEFKPVKLGYVTTDHVQITEGLNEGDLVVVEGLEELKDGAKVQVMEYQSTAF